MELLKLGKSNSYYDGQLLMYDGVRNGQSVYTVLSEVVLTRLPNNLYINAQTKEHYKLNDEEVQVGDIFCRIQDPLVKIKKDKDVEQYILSSPLFFKDRIEIYMNLTSQERKNLKMEKKILRDIEDNTIYHKIMKEQGPIVKAYAKIKR